MIVHAAICDDEAAFRSQLKSLLEKHSLSQGYECVIHEYASGEDLLTNLDPRTQLLFLDVGMPGITGIEAARKINEMPQNVTTIFVTSMVQYAIEGYDVHAFAFLTKPIRYSRFSEVVSSALERLSQTGSRRILVKQGQDTFIVPTADIYYVESFAHRMKVSLKERSFMTTSSMKDFEKDLDGCGFFRTHRCYLVNCRHVTSVHDQRVVLDNGADIPLSKQRRQDFMKTLDRLIGTWS